MTTTIRYITACAALVFAPVPASVSGGALASPSRVTHPHQDAVLAAVIASKQRPQNDRDRDRYRHPRQTLTFWGLKPGMTVVELVPEGGYWTEILGPYLKQTKGTYIAGVADLSDPNLNDGLRVVRQVFEAKHANQQRYGAFRYTGFGAVSGPLAAPDSVDMIIASREIHNWIRQGFFDKAMRDCFAALKPGGVLAVEQHRADPYVVQLTRPGSFTGYVATQTVIDVARKAGFVLDASSEINANRKDIKIYPFGVWTLAPVRRSDGDGHPALTDAERDRYDAIGESDRMTLRFRKPL